MCIVFQVVCGYADLIFIVRAHAYDRWIGDDQQLNTTVDPLEKKEERTKIEIISTKTKQSVNNQAQNKLRTGEPIFPALNLKFCNPFAWPEPGETTTREPVSPLSNSIAAVKKSRGTDHSVAELVRVYRLSLKKY